MRDRVLVGLVLAVGIWQGCSGGGASTEFSPDTLLPDTLDHDAASRFVGSWDGTATLTLGGRATTGEVVIDVAVTGRNLLTFPAFCGDGLGPTARVTSDDTFQVAGYRCPLPADDCTIWWDIRGGHGALSGAGVLELSLEGSASGCGRNGTTLSLDFEAVRQRIDHGPPTAALASDGVVARPGVDATLDASPSADPDGLPLTFAWVITGQPAGGDATLAAASTAASTFRASVPGLYHARVTVTASDGQSAAATVAVTVSPAPVAVSALSHRVLHAEYDLALNRIVMTDAETRALYVYDPATRDELSVALPLPPRCLSVSRDGALALVGHDGWITLIDVEAAQVEASLPTSTNPISCVLGSGWAYLFPADDWIPLRSVELATGAESGSGRAYTGSRGVLTPDGTAIYAVTLGLSPASLNHWDVSGGAATWAWEEWGAGGERLWIERSGARIFTSGGTALRTSSVQSQDMAAAGALEGLTSVAHLDSTMGQLAAIPAPGWDPYAAPVDWRVWLFDPDGLTGVGRIELPAWGAEGVLSHGRFVFYAADGSTKHVLVQADPGAGLVRDWAVLSYAGTKLLPQPAGDSGPPRAVIASPPLGTPGLALRLDGSASDDPDGRALTYEWTLLAQPPGPGATLSDGRTATPSLTATVPGAYAVQLTVSAADGQRATATAYVSVFPAALAALPHRVADAEYSAALNRIVMTDGSPSALYVYDPVSQAEVAVALPAAPRCVSVGPDGAHALVGHDGSISYVDLVQAVVEKSIAVAADVGDCVLGNGWAYLLPRAGQPIALHSVRIATGEDTPSSTRLYAGAVARLHPGGERLYSADTQVSPPDLMLWDVSAGPAASVGIAPYHGEYAVGPGLWMAADGSRILTAARTAFRSASLAASDMTYAGALDGGGLVSWVDAAADEVAAIPATYSFDPSTAMADTVLELFDPTYLGHVGTIALPTWTTAAGSFATHARFVFHGLGGTRHVIVQADAGSGLLHDTAVLSF